MVFSNHTTDSINERIPGAEPAPKWPEAKEKYQWAWELHYIGLACAYIMISLYSMCIIIVIIVRGRSRMERRSRTMVYLYAVHVLLVLFGITRAMFLLTDPYELDLDYPLVSTRLLFGLGFPCLTSSYSLLHVGFLEISRVRISGNKLSSKRFVGAVIALHFVVVIVADTTTALKRETALLLLVCMSFFIFWGLAISVSILYSGIKVLRKCQKQTNLIRALSDNKNSGGSYRKDSGGSHYKDFERRQHKEPGESYHKDSGGSHREGSTSGPTPRQFKMSSSSSRPDRCKKTARITLLTAVLAMSLCLCNLIALVGVYNVYRGVQENSKPWPWWSFQTIFRLIEIALAIVMGYAVTPVNLWGSDLVRRNTEMSVIRNMPRSRINTESAVYLNNSGGSSRPRSQVERTRTESLSYYPQVSTKKKAEAEKDFTNVTRDEKLTSSKIDEALLYQSSQHGDLSPKTNSLLILRL